MTNKVKVKARSNAITRRFEINSDSTWEDLKLQIKELFNTQDFTLKYIDDENELVTLGTHGELEEALKVTRKTGLLRLVVETPSDQGSTARIESFKDLLGESVKEDSVPQAPKRKFLSNPPAQSETSSAFKTAKMDDSEPSVPGMVAAPSSQEAATGDVCNDDLWKTTEEEKLPSKENEVPCDGDAAEATKENVVEFQVQNTLPRQPPCESVPEDTAPKDQYIPLVQLMQPPPSRPPQRPPPPAKVKKASKGRKGNGCYHQLAENLAVELASMNEKLHQKLRSSLDVMQTKEPGDEQQLGEVEEDSYVFVNQQGNVMAAVVNIEDENLLSSPNQAEVGPTETGEEGSTDDNPRPSDSSPTAAGNTSNPTNASHASVVEAVHRVVQESLPRIVEETMKNLQGLHISDPSASSSPMQKPGKSTSSKVMHKGIVCAGCSQAIAGIRYKCCFCTDYDLCEDCEGKEGIHDPGHFFAKLRHHVPGIGRKNGEMVPLLKKFVYRMALKEEIKNEKKEEKKREKDEKKEKKKEKKLAKAVKKDEKEKRELKRKTRMEWRQMRHERDSATALERLQNCLNAEFIADASIPDGTVLKGGEKFLKRWVVKNKGRRWNAKTVLQCVEGNILVASGENKVEVPFLKPDEQGELVVPFIAPAVPGHYESKWQLCHHSIPFGPLFWCQIIVEGENVECEVPLMQNSPAQPEPALYPSHDNTTLVNSAFPERNTSPVRKLVEDIVPQGVEAEEPDEASGSVAYLSSEDTAEFAKIRMPLESVLMASQAAQAAELEWDAAGCVLDTESCDMAQIEELMACATEDVASDAESISSDMSDEFMVVPVPSCFDPDAPLTADPSPVTVSITEYKQMTESQQGPFSFTLNNQTTLQSELKSGPSSASYIEQRSVSSIETTLEMTSRTTTEEENRVFDLAGETIPLLPEPLIPQPGLETALTMEAPPNLPITSEPLPAPEPSHNDNPDDNDDDDDEDDDHNRSSDGPVLPEASSQPIATQPFSGPDEPTPVALQPEPSTHVVTVPTTVPASEVTVVQRVRHNSSSSDFAANVVSDVLSTVIDAAASAGRAAITTVENLINGGPKPQTTATYNAEQGCEISVNPPPESDETPVQDAPEVHAVTWPAGRSPAACQECLMEMGFCDRKLNEQLLKKHNNNVALVVNELLSFTDNEWSTRRH
ncbi:uncharacterized protein LOC144631230 [Oculina patagonica]